MGTWHPGGWQARPPWVQFAVVGQLPGGGQRWTLGALPALHHPWVPTSAQPYGTLRLGRMASGAWLPTLKGGSLPSRPCFGVAPAPEASL